MQFEVLLHEGLHPASKVLDVGCGCLRAGYWLLHFLEPGNYFGIEPFEERLRGGFEYIIEPDVLERARPSFSHNDDFDLSVFGSTFDFVIARSIWSHTSKAQIQHMLDSFVVCSEPGSVLLASYLRASKLPDSVREPLYRLMRKVPKLIQVRRRIVGRRLPPADYAGDEWDSGLIGHSYEWISTECSRRGLAVQELDYAVENSQVWLRIERRRE